MNDDDFEEWKTWFDSHKEPNGTINLDKHPNFLAQALEGIFGRHSLNKLPNFDDCPSLGRTISFELQGKKS